MGGDTIAKRGATDQREICRAPHSRNCRGSRPRDSAASGVGGRKRSPGPDQDSERKQYLEAVAPPGLKTEESLYRPAYLSPPLPVGGWTSYTTFSSRSPGAEHRGRGGFRAVPAWVTSLNSAPPSGPIRESRRPRLSRASGPVVGPVRVRRRQPTVPFQPLPDVQSREPRSLRGLPRRAVIPPRCKPAAPVAWCRLLILSASTQTPPPPHPPLALCPRPSWAQTSLPPALNRPASRGRVTRKQEQPLGGARTPRPLARFSFDTPGKGSDAACSAERAPP